MSKSQEYLFDTNCFYSIGRDQKKIAALRASTHRITTASVAVAEIQRLKNNVSDRKFGRRQAAMFALDQLSSKIYITADFAALPKAFGQPYDKNAEYKRESIREFLNAKSPLDVDFSINDNIKEWKSNWQSYFSRGYREAISHSPTDEQRLRVELIMAYAYHAGVLKRETFEKAKSDEALFQNISKQTLQSYNGDLDFMITFLLKMNHVNYENKKIDKNRLFDIEFLFHMRPNDTDQIFVTTERELIEILQEVDKNRVADLKFLI